MRTLATATLLATLATTFVAAPAMAETITNKSMQITVDVPDNWKSSTDKDQITLSDQHENVAVTMVGVDAGAVKTATKAARHALEKKIDNLTFTKEETININGMTGIGFQGDGLLGGVNIDLMVLVVDTPNDDKDLMIIAIGEDAKIAKHKDEVSYIFRHLKPITH
jgi:hypothetical protein